MQRLRQYRGGFQFAGLLKLVRELRAKQTAAETLLWQLLRNRQLLGFKFRRQHQFGDYVTDFYCREAQLVIECDGLITRYQGIYGTGVLVGDGVIVGDGVLVGDGLLVGDGVIVGDSILTSNGLTLRDGSLFLSSSMLLADGVLLADGMLLADGVIVSDGVLVSDSINGDNTRFMTILPD